jgi:hypothetical protein
MDEEEAGVLLLAQEPHSRRLRLFSAMLAKESGLGTAGMTVVGGSAIEIYTEGEYVSEDIDLVVRSRSRVVAVLTRWGFRDEGKLLSKAAWKLYVDPMEVENSGSQRLTRVISTSAGPFSISGVEDLVIRRVRESVAWQGRQEAFVQAVLLVRHNSADLDWEYIQFFAKREGWDGQLETLRVNADPTQQRG